MSNPTLEIVETTLKSLKDIVVDRNPDEPTETSQLVEDMEQIIADLKIKTNDEPRNS